MTRIGMGLVGPGFVGAHHIDAVRRLGFVDVVAIAGEQRGLGAAEGRRARRAEGVRQLRGARRRSRRPRRAQHDAELSARAGDPGGARAAASTSSRTSRSRRPPPRRGGCCDAASDGRRRPRRDVQLPRQPAGAAGARDDRRRRARRRAFHPRRATCRTGCSRPTDFSWRLEPEKGGASSAVGDIGSHWCDLVQHVTGQRIVEVLADLTTVVGTRLKPPASTEAFAQSGDAAREPVAMHSEDLATILRALRRRREGQRVGRAGLRRPQERSVVRGERPPRRRCAGCRSGRTSCGSAAATRANAMLPKDPSLLGAGARARTRTCRAAIRKAGPTRSAT